MNGETIEIIEIPDIATATANIQRHPGGTLRIFFPRCEEDGGDIQVRCEPNSYSVEEEILPCPTDGKMFNYIWPEEMRGSITRYDSKARLTR